MFCDQCGREATADAHFCSNCGRPLPGRIAGQAVPVQPIPVYAVRTNRVEAHVRILGVLWIVDGALNLLSVLSIWFVGRMIFPSVMSVIGDHSTFGDPFNRLVQGGLVFAAALLAIQTVLALFAAWGLVDRQGWGRIVAIVAGILSLWRIPFGTALGIYTLWVLLPASSEVEYRNLARV
jgi:hypothetical protein